jgi:hypothetical protein
MIADSEGVGSKQDVIKSVQRKDESAARIEHALSRSQHVRRRVHALTRRAHTQITLPSSQAQYAFFMGEERTRGSVAATAAAPAAAGRDVEAFGYYCLNNFPDLLACAGGSISQFCKPICRRYFRQVERENRIYCMPNLAEGAFLK